MAETFSLKAEKREVSKYSAREARRMARVPGIVYGHGVDNQVISVGYSDFLRVFRRAGTASIIDLEVGGKGVKVLVQSVDMDPVRDEFTHVDFRALNLKEKTIVKIPLVYSGEAPAVKNHGGTFMANHEVLEIRCLPTDIPHDIAVDISGIEELHGHISIKDLGLDASKFEVMHMDEDTVICSVIGRSSAESAEASGEGETEEASEVATKSEEGA